MNTPNRRSTRLHPNGFVYQELPLSPRSSQTHSEVNKLSHDFEEIVKLESKMEIESAFQAEQCETPERKAGPFHPADNSLTVKKETPSIAIAVAPQQPVFKTPPKRPMTLPTMEELERWERQEREMNRRRL